MPLVAARASRSRPASSRACASAGRPSRSGATRRARPPTSAANCSASRSMPRIRLWKLAVLAQLLEQLAGSCPGSPRPARGRRRARGRSAPSSRPSRFARPSSSSSAAWSEPLAGELGAASVGTWSRSLSRFWAGLVLALETSSACASKSDRSAADRRSGFAELDQGPVQGRGVLVAGLVPAARAPRRASLRAVRRAGRPRRGGGARPAARRASPPADAERPDRRPSTLARGGHGGPSAAGRGRCTRRRGARDGGRAARATRPCGRRGRPRGAGGRPAASAAPALCSKASARSPRGELGRNAATPAVPSSQADRTSRQPSSRRCARRSRSSSVGTSCSRLQGLHPGLELARSPRPRRPAARRGPAVRPRRPGSAASKRSSVASSGDGQPFEVVERAATSPAAGPGPAPPPSRPGRELAAGLGRAGRRGRRPCGPGGRRGAAARRRAGRPGRPARVSSRSTWSSMPGDRLAAPRRAGPRSAANCCRQGADDRRLVGAEPQRLGRVEVGRPAQLAEESAGLVLVLVPEVLQRWTRSCLALSTAPSRSWQRLDLVGRVEQGPRAARARASWASSVSSAARGLADRVLGQLRVAPARRGSPSPKSSRRRMTSAERVELLAQRAAPRDQRHRRLDPLRAGLLDVGPRGSARRSRSARSVASR